HARGVGSRSGRRDAPRSRVTINITGGTLKRVTVNGGPMQTVAEKIFEADWSSDGLRLALVSVVDGAQQLEFPQGQTLYRTSGWLSNARVSPANDAVAFIEHPARHE